MTPEEMQKALTDAATLLLEQQAESTKLQQELRALDDVERAQFAAIRDAGIERDVERLALLREQVRSTHENNDLMRELVATIQRVVDVIATRRS